MVKVRYVGLPPGCGVELWLKVSKYDCPSCDESGQRSGMSARLALPPLRYQTIRNCRPHYNHPSFLSTSHYRSLRAPAQRPCTNVLGRSIKSRGLSNMAATTGLENDLRDLSIVKESYPQAKDADSDPAKLSAAVFANVEVGMLTLLLLSFR